MTISKLYDELGLGVVHQRWKWQIDEELFPFYAFYQMEYKEQKKPVLHPKLCIDNFLLDIEIVIGVDIATLSIISYHGENKELHITFSHSMTL
jgi:hypothetical protein